MSASPYRGDHGYSYEPTTHLTIHRDGRVTFEADEGPGVFAVVTIEEARAWVAEKKWMWNRVSRRLDQLRSDYEPFPRMA